MATPLSSLVVLFSLGICSGEGLGALWSGVGGGSEGLPPVALPVPGPSPHRPPVGPSGTGGPGGSAALFAEEPADVVVRKGADAVLRCSASAAYASWPLSWSKDGQALDKDKGHFTVDRRGSLVVHQVSRSDKYVGKYRCALQGPQGVVVSRAASLHVASLSHVVQGPNNVTLPAGGTARFSCAVDSVPTARVTWKKDDKPLLPDSRYVSLPSGVLLISNVTLSDEGTYKCITTNDVLKKSRISNDAFLQVHQSSTRRPPTFLSQTRLVQIPQGENVSLECSYSGSSLPAWTSTNAFLQSSSNISLPGISILTFHNVDENHSGTYNCTFREAAETSFLSIELRVLVPPTVLEPPESQSYPTARTARFTCAVRGVPLPTITWYKNGAVIKHSAENGRIKLFDKELLISNSIASDTGFYQCMFHNSVGENWGLAHLYVNSSRLQAPPSNLTCHENGDDFIIVHWNPPMEDVTAYTVHYWASGSVMQFKEYLVTKNFCPVLTLQPYTNYTFAVRSYSRRGASEPSHVTCQTKESVPSVAPQVSLTTISASKLNVSWVPLDPAKTFGHITEYKVQWRQVPRSTAKVKEVSAKVLNFTITDLVPGGTYEVRVLARTKQGWPKPSVEAKLEWTSVKMPSQTSPDVVVGVAQTPISVTSSSLSGSVDASFEPPFGLEAEATSPFTINVTWSAPPLVSVQYYSVMIKEVQSSHQSESGDPIVINCTTQWLEIDELQPNTIYEIMLKAFDKKGHSSPFSEKIESRTFENAPDVVTDVSWELLNSTAVKVMWKSPSSPVKQFNVTLVPLDGSVPIYLLVNGSRSSTEVVGVKPYTAYHLTVWGITRGGTGPPSPTQMVFTNSPEVVQSPPGEQFATQSPDVRLVLSASICGSIAFTVLVMALFWHHTINRSSRRGAPISTSNAPNSYHPNGNGINGQLPLTSFVVPDPGPYCYPLGVRRVDTEVQDRNSTKRLEEGSVTLLPPGSNPTPIGANLDQQGVEMKDLAAKARTSPGWSGVLPRHVFNITENPQCDSTNPGKNLPSRYSHERSVSGDYEEMVELLSPLPTAHKYCESECEDMCGETGDTSADSLNVTQITEIDQSFQDRSNNNNDIHKSNVSTISSQSSVNEEQSRSSSSFLGDTSEGSNDITEQHLLVTLSTVPVHHLATKPFIDVPKLSVVGPNG